MVICGGTGGMLRACNTDLFLTQDLMEADEKRGGVSQKKIRGLFLKTMARKLLFPTRCA